MKQKRHLYFSTQWGRRYSGKYIAVLNGKIVAIGRNSLDAFEKLKEKFPHRKEGIGVYYIPTQKELVTCLLNFLI